MERVQPHDSTLLERAKDGDLEAFGELVRRHEHGLRAVVFRLLDDERDVDEAVQDSFVQAWRNLGRFRGDAAVFTWLYRIAVNEALARLRRKRLPLVEIGEAGDRQLVDADRTRDPEHMAEAKELQAVVAARVRALAPEYRVPLVLRDVVGLSNEEVAGVLELSVPATKSRIHRARMQIRADLARWESGERDA